MTESSQKYFRLTRTATYGFLGALPLVLMYEILILATAGDGPSAVRVGADVWIKEVIHSVGANGMFALGLLVLVIGAVVLVVERKKAIEIRPSYFGMMIAESLLYAVLVAFLVSSVVGLMFNGAIFPEAAAMQESPGGTSTMIALSIGAGVYEELLFRVILVGGLFLALSTLEMSRESAYIASAIIGALIFSAVHYIGPFGDAFELPSFTFRFLFGLLLNGLFLVRGFGVAAWTHALYDIMVVTHLLG